MKTIARLGRGILVLVGLVTVVDAHGGQY